MLAVGEHLGLRRQVGAAEVHQIDAGQPVLARDFLGAQMFLDRHRMIAAALDGGVVGHDHAFAAFDAADAGDDAGAVDVAVVHADRRRAATAPETASRDRSGSSPARAAAACRARHAARAPSPSRPRPPRRGAPAVPRSARACARHWRGIRRELVSMADDKIANVPSPVSATKGALAEPGTQWRGNCGRTKIVELTRPRDVLVKHATTSSTSGGAHRRNSMRKARLLSTVRGNAAVRRRRRIGARHEEGRSARALPLLPSRTRRPRRWRRP